MGKFLFDTFCFLNKNAKNKNAWTILRLQISNEKLCKTSSKYVSEAAFICLFLLGA